MNLVKICVSGKPLLECFRYSSAMAFYLNSLLILLCITF